ncbi:DNA-binding response regulator [Vallitalea longa]|uniref:Stage 0 sporulation protein A homolog n=1 Tax=Vallitalea longa TaxID=2936439 RepID=A0A9W5YB15_9FIRM|nr:response regulator transcription factor [Vallitalea longa]GKX29819.1 DNA-binding response regulator [Vallitalea longa]
MLQYTILVVDDEKEICNLIKDYLVKEGFNVILAYDGQQAINYYKEFNPILAILDIMLPIIDGMEICRYIRSQSNIPILMLSAKKTDIDKILGLGLGADDYITKPFSPKELVARVKAHIRRYTILSSQKTNPSILKYNNLEIDIKGYNVSVNGNKVDLASKEFEVLSYLALHPNQVFTREQIFNHVWGFDEYGDINTVTVHIRRIREKIEKISSEPMYIKTVWGVGYKFEGVE